MTDRTPEQHADIVREALCPNWPHPGIVGCSYCIYTEDAQNSLAALARLAADAERLRETGGLAAIVLSVLADHDDTCDHALNGEYVCSCGHDLLVAAFGDAVASPPADTERITHGRHCVCSSCKQEDWTQPHLAPCGMHGSSCPPVYDPRGGAGDVVPVPANTEQP